MEGGSPLEEQRAIHAEYVVMGGSDGSGTLGGVMALLMRQIDAGSRRSPSPRGPPE
jgi:hypothetical protein